jgi:general secretion pathway protein D
VLEHGDRLMLYKFHSRFRGFRQPTGKAARAVAGLCTAAIVSACSLASEQLSLPTAIGPSSTETGSLPNPKGVALGDPATPGAAQSQIYQGSADYTKSPRPQAQQQGRAFGGVSGEGVTLNLAGASVAEAAKAVLGDVLGVNYTVSDKVQGSVTLQTSKPVSKDGVLEIFESVLASSDAAILVDGPVYRIVSREEAFNSGKPMTERGGLGPRAPGMSSEIVPLRYVSATEMERILKSVAPQGMVARVDSARNLLVLTGTRSDLSSMIETVNVFDVDWMRNMSFGIFPIETSDTEAIAQELDTIFANDRDSPSKGVVRFVPNARMKAIVVITSRPEYLKKAETWIKRIDMAGEATEKRAFVYNVQYRPVQELAALLQKIYVAKDPNRTGSLRETTLGAGPNPIEGPFAGTDAPSDPSHSRDWTTGAAPIPLAPVANQTRPGTSGVAGGAFPAPVPQGSEQGVGGGPSLLPADAVAGGMLAKPVLDDRASGISIVADESNNALVISATPSEIKRIRQILTQIDVIPAQVMIEATIAEVTLNDDLKFGLRWFFEKGGSEFKLSDTLAGGAIGAIAPAFAGFSYFLNTPNAKVVLNALADVTNVNVVSSPSLMVLNNKKAVLQVGDEVPVATRSAVTVDNPDAPIVNSIEFRHTGVLLNITPRVSDDGRILLEIDQEISDAKATTSSTIDSPTIQQRRIKTTVAVNDGGSVVLAGMMQDKATRTRQQVPLIGDIPLLGNAFKNKDDVISRTELLIAITPHIVKDNHQIGEIAAEFRDRLNFNTRPQRATPPDHRETFDRISR